MVRTILALSILCSIFTARGMAQVQQSLNLMPMPAKVQLGSGRLLIGPSFSVAITGHKEPRLDAAVDLFLTQLRRQTGMPPIDMKIADSATATLVIQCDGGTKDVQQLGEDESYRLEIAATGAPPERAHHARRHARIADLPATGADHAATASPCRRFPSRTARGFPGAG